MDIISEFIIVIVTNYILYNYLSSKYSFSEYKISVVICFFTASVIITIINFYKIPFLNVLCYLILVFIMDYFYFSPPKYLDYFLDEMILIYMALLDSITHFFIQFIFDYLEFNSDKIQLYYIKGYMSLLLIIILCIFIKLFYLERDTQYYKFKGNILYISFPIGSIILLLLLGGIVSLEEKAFLIGQCLSIAILLMVLNILNMWSLFSINERYGLEILYINERNKSQMQKKYYDDIRMKYDLTREMVHDFNNHLNIMKSIKNPDILDRYIGDIKGKLDSTGLNINTGNKIIDLIVNDKIILAKKKNIIFETIFSHELKNDMLLYISEFDMVGMLANILDNSIEACEFVQLGKINLEIKKIHNMVSIKVKNICINNMKIDRKGNVITTKVNHRGIGLNIVKKIVERYEGIYSMEIEDGICNTNIILPIHINQ